MYAKKHLIFTVLALVLFFLVGWKGAEYYYFSQINTSLIDTPYSTIADTGNPQNVNLSLYWDVWEEIENFYIDETAVQDDQNLVYGTIKGLVDSLDDPYTVFVEPVAH